MKKRLVVLPVLLAVVVSSSVSARPLFGPKGKFSTFINDLRWEPTYNCPKPYRPMGNDKFAWEMYKSSALRYLECLEESAKSDKEYAIEIVNEGYEKAANEFLEEVKRGY